MTISKFNKAPLSPLEKEKKAEEFLGFRDAIIVKQTEKSKDIERRLEKESMKPFLLRIPLTLFDDLREIGALTGISVNAICLELLRPSIKRKLRELKIVSNHYMICL